MLQFTISKNPLKLKVMKSIQILFLFLFLGYNVTTVAAQSIVKQNNVEYLEDNSNDLNTIKVLPKTKVEKKKMPSQKKHIERVMKKNTIGKVLKNRKRLRFRNRRNQKPGKCYKEDVCDDKK